jgi:integrase/recombinase XerD
MQKEKFSQGITFKIYPQKHRRADNTNSIYLRVTIDRKKREFNLSAAWPVEFWDSAAEVVLPRYPKDPDVKAVNMLILEAKGRANRIKLIYFTQSRTLTLIDFEKEFITYESREDFLYYWQQKQAALLKSNIIVKATVVRHETGYRRFKEFLGEPTYFSMHDLNENLVLEFQAWLRKSKKLMHNTVVSSLKILKTYVNHAIKDEHKIKNPFEHVKYCFQPGERNVCNLQEMLLLKSLLDTDKLDELEREVLIKYVFSCFTGLRISDSDQLHSSMFNNNTLIISPKKGFRFGKVLIIPVPQPAMELIAGRQGYIFRAIADQTCNQMLKRIGIKAGFTKKLSFRSSRDTFATIFIELGGDIATLMEIMGHSDIRTTKIYLKISENRKETLMSNFNHLPKLTLTYPGQQKTEQPDRRTLAKKIPADKRVSKAPSR